MRGPDVKILNDGWTVVTQDGSLSAHFEHTVLITEGEPEILTCPETDAFKVEGVVVEVLPNGTCRVELANGIGCWPLCRRGRAEAGLGRRPGTE